MIHLYYWPTPNGKKVTILLEECGLPYKVVPCSIGQGDQFKDEFLRISPNNRMPALRQMDTNLMGSPGLKPCLEKAELRADGGELAQMGHGAFGLGTLARPSSSVATIANDPTLNFATFNFWTARRCFDELARETAFSWNIDGDKVLTFSALGSVSRGVTFSNSNGADYSSIRVKKTREN